mgnify:CR=1 FL=1
MERIRENLIKESLMNIRFFAQSEYFNGIHIKDDIILEKGLLANKSDSFEAIFGIKPVLREKRKL